MEMDLQGGEGVDKVGAVREYPECTVYSHGVVKESYKFILVVVIK